jgi:Ca2+-binding EF-hand superfamily protein
VVRFSGGHHEEEEEGMNEAKRVRQRKMFETAFNKYDLDGGGTIDYEEFLKAPSRVAAARAWASNTGW